MQLSVNLAVMLNASFLLIFFNSVYVLALCAWVGSIAFFSFGVAPIIFRVLGTEAGGRFVRVLFPRYYAWGATACAIALPAVVCGPMANPELRGPIIGLQAALIVAGLIIMFYCGNSLTAAINKARDAGPGESARFDSLHRRSVWLNGLSLLIGVSLLVIFAARAQPNSGGIRERAPGELSEGQQKLMRDSVEIEKILSDPKTMERLRKAMERRDATK